jgi:hypothetical protein
MFDSTKVAATLLDCVSAADAERLEGIHGRLLSLSGAQNVNATTRELAGFIYEILRMPIYHKTIADRLNEQHRRIFQAVSGVQTALIAIDAMDEADDKMAALRGTLSLVKETLTDIAEQIEPPVVLARAVAHGYRRTDPAGRASCPDNG